jgi:serine/threonine protein kinase
MASGPADKGKRRPVRIGKYEVEDHVATGGMGAVYRARDTESGRKVALKVLSPDMAAKPVIVQRFQQEARNAAKLHHENIVAYYDCGEVNGTYYLAQEFVDGRDLHDYVSRKGPLAPEEACAIILQAACALDHANQQGIVHRDIKPSNFLLSLGGGRPIVKLTDLGLAREVQDEDFRLTRDGTTVGTLDYMSPEQARDSRAADIRSDLYSLGCTFYYTLAGQPPFPKGSIAERLRAHAEAEPPDVREANPAVGPGLAALLQRLLAKRPEDRFQTPAELLEALADPERWAADFFREPGLMPLDEEETPTPQPARAPARRGPQPPENKTAPPQSSGQLSLPRRATTERARKKPISARRSRRARRRWWPWTAAAVSIVVVLVAVFLLWSGNNPPSPDQRTGGDSSRSSGTIVQRPNLPTRSTSSTSSDKQSREHEPSRTGSGPQPVYPTRFGPTPAEVRKEYEGPLADLSVTANKAPIFHVSRLPGAEPNTFPSLASALAQVPQGGTAVLEILDNGPLFEPSLPELNGRTLVIRAGKGYRPLLAWDSAAATGGLTPRRSPEGGPGARLLALDKGNLVLEDLDVVVKGTDPAASQPAALFHIKDGFLIARRCTFSVAGKQPQGIVVAWLEGTSPCRGRLSHCYARGADLILLHLQGPASEVLIDDCLVAGGGRTLCQVGSIEEAPATLRLVRSTLVCGRTLLGVHPLEESQRKIALKVFCADSLLAQGDPGSDSVLLQLDKGIAANRVAWKASNSVYTGWKLLLASAGRNIPSAALESEWWRLQGYMESDRALPASWPRDYPAEPDDLPPAAFDPSGSQVHFAALTRPGAVGCNLAELPAGRSGWLALTWDRLDLPLPSLPLGDVPPLPRSSDGLYHGEQLHLTKNFDLGKHLASRLAAAKPAPRIVLELEGSGDVPTSPIRLKGCSLVLTVGESKRGKEPLTLVPALGAAEEEALIQVAGDLEMIGVRIRIPETQARAAPRHLVTVHGGSLRLFGCHLQGLLAGGGAYQGLIDLDSADHPSGATPTCSISDSVLLSAGSVLFLHDGIRLRLHQSLALAADDLLVLDLASIPSGPQVQWSLEHSTLAARRNLLEMRGPFKPAGTAGPLLLRSQGCAFLAPFDKARASTLLRCDRSLVTQGLLLWQGTGNGFDRRLHSYLTVPGEPSTGPQPFASWLRLWGTPGERGPLLLDLPKVPFRLSPLRLRALALPRTIRPQPGETLPGADFVRLGIAPARN